jgi:hypothetical protein
MSRGPEVARGLADNPAHDALLIGLDAAVPLRMLDLGRMCVDRRRATAKAWAAEAADVIACKGDVLQYGSKRRGEAADAFNHLARGLAALAQSPGGVLFAGRHWCIEHQWGTACADITALTCDASGLDVEQTGRPAFVTIVTTEVL